MSESWAKRVKTLCDNYNISLEDTSTIFHYEATLTAPDGCVLWGTESESYRIIMTRVKGSRKEHFWYAVFSVAETGAIHKDQVDNWVVALPPWTLP
jgi:hypothetical protein